MKPLLIATGNIGKHRELLECFPEAQNHVRFTDLRAFPSVEEPEEHGQTFEENALLKASFYGKTHNIPTLGEDSGLILEAFPEKFGLRTRREIEAADDIQWLEQFLTMLESEENRRATFYSAIAFFEPETGTEQVFLGSTSGVITEFPQAPLEPGIPVSAVFIPEGKQTVYSAMTKAEKTSLSHRGKAGAKMQDFLLDWAKK